MSFLQNSLDSLFEENIPSPLYLLPAEIRNSIFQEVLFESINSTLAIKISETGKIILPPLMAVSKQIYTETYGYIASALRNPTTKFEATVRSYDARPLFATMKRISQQTGICEGELVARTQVQFVGNVDMDNLLLWIQGSISNPTAFPIFPYKKMDIPAFTGENVFEGRLSLKRHILSYSAFSQRGKLPLWNQFAREFLINLEERALDVLGEPKEHMWLYESDAEIQNAVLKTFAWWHDIFLQKEMIQARVFGRKERKRVEDEHVFVATAMAGFGESVEGEMRMWGL